MASWHDRLWPARRWLADRIIGDHAYSRNVARPEPAIWLYPDSQGNFTNPATGSSASGKITVRNPGETS